MNITFNLNEGWGMLQPQPIRVDNLMPARDRWVLVFTPKYRCLGFQEQGVWRDVAHGKRIDENVLAWMPLDEPAAA